VLGAPVAALAPHEAFTLGIRPEYVQLTAPDSPGAVPGVVTQAQDIGTYWLLSARVGESLLRARLGAEHAMPQVGEAVWLGIAGEHTCWYVDEELVA
jgi:glycerol transport system ATP-binding protein